MDLFSRIAHNYDRIIPSFDISKIIDYIPINKNDLLVDLGGGTGRVSVSLREHYNECLILDRSFEMLLEAKKKSNSLLIIHGSSDSLPFRDNTIPQIFANDSLHHIHPQEETINECYNALCNGGKLTIREFDRGHFWNKFLIFFEWVLRFGSKFLTPLELKKMCENYNFTVTWQKLTKATFILIASK